MHARLLTLFLLLFVASVATAQPVGECWLAIGFDQTSVTVGSDPADVLLVDPLLLLPVTMTTMPTFDIPTSPSVQGMHVYLQAAMFNPAFFPQDPVQFTNGLDFEIGTSLSTFGQPVLLQLGALATGGHLVTSLVLQ